MLIYLLNNTRKILHYVYKADIRLGNVQLYKNTKSNLSWMGGLMKKNFDFCIIFIVFMYALFL